MASYHRLDPDDGAQDIIIGISLVTSIAAGLLAGHSMSYTALTIVPSALCASLLLSDAFHTGLRMRQRHAVLSFNDEEQLAWDGLSQARVQEKFEGPGNVSRRRRFTLLITMHTEHLNRTTLAIQRTLKPRMVDWRQRRNNRVLRMQQQVLRGPKDLQRVEAE